MKGQSVSISLVKPGQLCGYFDHDIFIIGMVLSTAENHCSLGLNDAEQVNLSCQRLVIISEQIFPIVNPAGVITDFSGSINSLLPALNPKTVWENLPAKSSELTLEDIIRLSELPVDDLHRFACYLALRQCQACFRFKDGFYYPRSEEDYRLALLGEEQQRLDNIFYAEISSWLQSLMAISQPQTIAESYPPLPKETRERLEHELKSYQHGKFPSPLSRILPSIDKTKSHPDWLLLIRRALGQIDETTPPLIAAANLPHIFPADIRSNASMTAAYTHQLSRIDLRELQCLTVDSEGTKDMDDAVSLQKTAEGWQLGIHISDVAYFIKSGSLIDREAFNRTSSIYLPGIDIHMLPAPLAEEIASLRLGQDRPALSLLCSIDADYRIISAQLVLSTIRVSSRLTYDEFELLLQAPETEIDEPAEWVRVIGKIAEKHLQQRLDAGALVFPDSSQTPARRTIAECMVIYNSYLADVARKANLPFFFRYLDEPASHPEDTDTDQTVMTPPSVLGISPQPHRAMGLPVYAQLSSPLRRYSDLVNQRQIVAHLLGSNLSCTVEDLQTMLPHILQTRQTIRRVTLQAEQIFNLGRVQNSHLNSRTTAEVIRYSKGRTSLYLNDFNCRISTSLPRKFRTGTRLNLRITELQTETGFAVVELLD